MSPSKREREYERRRYEKWANRRAQQAERQRRFRVVAAATSAVVVVLVATVALILVQGSGDHGPSVAASPTGPTTGTAGAGAAAVAGCSPAPTSTPSPGSWSTPPPASTAQRRSWTLTLTTTCGTVVADLDGAAAPQAVSSTIFLARHNFYAGTPCHRLTTSGIYVLQCGDPTGSGTGGPGYSYGPVENAPADSVYPAGTIAMARQSGQASSMGSQFFLVYRDSTIPADSAGGYTVIGHITSGLDVVKRIAAAGVAGGATDGAPSAPVSILGATVEPAPAGTSSPSTATSAPSASPAKP